MSASLNLNVKLVHQLVWLNNPICIPELYFFPNSKHSLCYLSLLNYLLHDKYPNTTNNHSNVITCPKYYNDGLPHLDKPVAEGHSGPVTLAQVQYSVTHCTT